MPNYTIRIQLVGNPDESVYNDLHARMQRGGFARTVSGSNSSGAETSSPLPHGTYYGASDADVGAVRDWARSHEEEAWGKNMVFVAQTETWAWGRA